MQKKEDTTGEHVWSENCEGVLEGLCGEALSTGQCRKGGAMQKYIVVAVMASVAWALTGSTAMGQVAGSTMIGVTVEEQKVLLRH